VYEEYGLNITKFKTVSALSLQIYLSNFYDDKYDIKLIKEVLKRNRKRVLWRLVHLNCEGKRINRGYYTIWIASIQQLC